MRHCFNHFSQQNDLKGEIKYSKLMSFLSGIVFLLFFFFLFLLVILKLLYFLTNELQLLCHVHYVSNLKIVSVLSLMLNSYFKKLNSELCNLNG